MHHIHMINAKFTGVDIMADRETGFHAHADNDGQIMSFAPYGPGHTHFDQSGKESTGPIALPELIENESWLFVG